MVVDESVNGVNQEKDVLVRWNRKSRVIDICDFHTRWCRHAYSWIYNQRQFIFVLNDNSLSNCNGVYVDRSVVDSHKLWWHHVVHDVQYEYIEEAWGVVFLNTHAKNSTLYKLSLNLTSHCAIWVGMLEILLSFIACAGEMFLSWSADGRTLTVDPQHIPCQLCPSACFQSGADCNRQLWPYHTHFSKTFSNWNCGQMSCSSYHTGWEKRRSKSSICFVHSRTNRKKLLGQRKALSVMFVTQRVTGIHN